MEDLLNPQVSGSLEEMGLGPSRNPPDEPEEYVEEVQEQPEVEAASEEPEEVPSEEEEVELSEEDQLAQYLAPEKSEESEVDRLRRELELAQATVQGRLEEINNQIRARAEQPVKEEKQESYFQSPAIQAVLSNLDPDNPAEMGAALATILEKQLEDRLEKKLGGLQQNLESEKRQTQAKQLIEQQNQRVQNQLKNEFDQGGIRAKIVENFYQSQGESLLAKEFEADPTALLSGNGIIGAITNVERKLRAKAGTRQSPKNSGSSVEETATGGSASKRGLDLGKPKSKLSPEEQMLEDMMGYKSPADKLGIF